MYATTFVYPFLYLWSLRFHRGCLINLIDKTDSSDLLKREDYCRSALKTMAPFGLNIEENV